MTKTDTIVQQVLKETMFFKYDIKIVMTNNTQIKASYFFFSIQFSLNPNLLEYKKLKLVNSSTFHKKILGELTL